MIVVPCCSRRKCQRRASLSQKPLTAGVGVRVGVGAGVGAGVAPPLRCFD